MAVCRADLDFGSRDADLAVAREGEELCCRQHSGLLFPAFSLVAV